MKQRAREPAPSAFDGNKLLQGSKTANQTFFKKRSFPQHRVNQNISVVDRKCHSKLERLYSKQCTARWISQKTRFNSTAHANQHVALSTSFFYWLSFIHTRCTKVAEAKMCRIFLFPQKAQSGILNLLEASQIGTHKLQRISWLSRILLIYLLFKTGCFLPTFIPLIDRTDHCQHKFLWKDNV